MGWRDNLLLASFRGVPFFYRDTDGEGGRRLAVNEFPFRDQAYVEDIGKKNRTYKLAAYVLGDGYFAARAALIAALETPGPGTLLHPYLGPLSVQVQKFTWKDALEAGRETSFDLEFVDAGSLPSPVGVVDTSGAALVAAQAMNAQIALSFSLGFAVAGYPAFVATAAASLLGNAGAALAGLVAQGLAAGGSMTAAQGFSAALASAGTNAAAISAAVTGFTAAYANAVVDAFPAFDDTLSSRGPASATDPTYGLAALASWGSTLAPVIVVDTATQQMADNQATLVALVEGSAATGIATLYANTVFASSDDAGAARDQITGLIDGLAFGADAAGDDAGYAAWTALYAASAADLTTRGKGLPYIATYDFGASLPALTLSQRLYQDADEAGDLIARNAAPHPLFLPTAIEALVS